MYLKDINILFSKNQLGLTEQAMFPVGTSPLFSIIRDMRKWGYPMKYEMMQPNGEIIRFRNLRQVKACIKEYYAK